MVVKCRRPTLDSASFIERLGLELFLIKVLLVPPVVPFQRKAWLFFDFSTQL